MRLVQLVDMRNDAASRLNRPAPTTTSNPSIAQWNLWLNKGVAELFNLVVAAAGTDAYEKTATISFVANTTDYALPADFHELRNVALWLDAAGSDRVTLERYMPSDEPYLMSATPGWNGEPFKYRELGKTSIGGADGGTIRFLPAPSGALKATLTYIFAPTTLVNDWDMLDGFAGFDDYAVVYATRIAASATEQRERGAEWLGEMMRIKENVLGTMRSRNAAQAPRVNCTRDLWRPARARMGRWGR